MRRVLLAISFALLLAISSTPLVRSSTGSGAGVSQTQGSASPGQANPSEDLAAGISTASGRSYVDYAIETANRVTDYQWDTTNLGYYEDMNQNWMTINDSSKQLTYKYWALAWFWLYDKTGNATYFDYAESYMNVLLDKAWDNKHGGFYDSYTSNWTNDTEVKSAAGNGITLWELVITYERTGDTVYYAYANKTANWLIDTLWDGSSGCFWQDNTEVGKQTYVEGCSDVIIGLMSLYQLNGNETYLGYVSKSINFIISTWDNEYGGFYARVDSTGSCATITYACNKYPNENTWPIIALSYYYKISGDTSALSYANRGISYINSTLWDWNPAYNGGLFRSLYQNNTIRDDTKTAWDNCGEPWMIWVASENVGGNSTYQTLARRILGFCTTYLHDNEYGGFVTEVSRDGSTITFPIKDAESLSDSIASLSIVTPAPTPATNIPYLDLSVTLANRLHDHMLDTASNTYYYELSGNWQTVLSSTFSTLGNAFIVLGFLQLYQATANETYLSWASSTSESFWRNGWDTAHAGFYDTYSSSWKNTTCIQTTQPNALFEIDFLELASANGSAVWLQRANSVESMLNGRFWDASEGVPEQSYNVCTGEPSGDVQIEVSIGSYLWATAEWQKYTSNSTFLGEMTSAASFAEKYLWDGSSNTLPGGPDSNDCGTTSGYLGFMRSVYANLTGLEDCRKGANENVWGAMGLAELYNITGSSTLLQYTNQDLSWINNTLWDPANGGYHETTYRNDTLRSACSSTGDPRDYPGWTEGEQPMFWWQIGQLTENVSERNWAGVAEQWTAEHQWNSTDGNGGDMTCLNSDTLPDEGQATLYDWVQGSALYTYSTIPGPAVAPPRVVQPLEVKVSEAGAPLGTYTISGCSPSPDTGTTGSVFSISMSASCSFVVSFTNIGGVRWGFITGGTFSSMSSGSTCSGGTCSEISLNADYQAQLTVNGGNDVTYSLKSETGDGWYKYGDSLTVSSNGVWGRTSSSGTRLASWNLDGGPNTVVATKGTVTTTPISMTSAHAVNFNAVTQHPVTFTDSPSAGGTSAATTSPSIPGDTGWYDLGSVVSISATANSGYAFASWKGAGSGSYSGNNNPASITVNAAIKETATFSSLGPRPSSTSVSPNAATVALGKTVSFTAKVADTGSGTKTAPTGTVSWSDGGAGGTFSSASCTLASVTSSMSTCAVVYTSPSTVGSIAVTATYSGDTTHSGSAGKSSLSVLRASSTKVIPAKTSETLGSLTPVTLTATVTDTSSGTASTPTGTVTWNDGGKGGTFSSTTCTLSPSGSGSSECTVTYTPSSSATAGTIKVSASYSGDGSHVKSTGSGLIVISAASGSDNPKEPLPSSELLVLPDLRLLLT